MAIFHRFLYPILEVIEAEAPSSRVIFPLAFTEGSELPSGGWISTTWGERWKALGTVGTKWWGKCWGKMVGVFFLIDQD